MLIKCESQENTYSNKMCLLLSNYLESLGKRDEILETVRKKWCIFCKKDNMRKDLDIGVPWFHEAVLEVLQNIMSTQNASHHLWMYN